MFDRFALFRIFGIFHYTNIVRGIFVKQETGPSTGVLHWCINIFLFNVLQTVEFYSALSVQNGNNCTNMIREELISCAEK